MFDFSHLNNLEVVTPEKEAKVRTNVAKEDKYPTGLTLRVYANGNVFPSKDLTTKLNLEYTAKDSEDVTNGLDVFAFSKMPNAPQIPQDCIMVSAVSKKAPKVDLFGSCKYEEDGSPKSSVLTQGGGTFGEDFVALVKEVYGIEIEKGSFLDLEVRLDISPKVSPIVYLPKSINRGPNKGQLDVARRENITIYPLVPIVAVEESMTLEEMAKRQLATHDEVVEEQLVVQREEEDRDEDIAEGIPEVEIVPGVVVNGEAVETTPIPAPIVENAPIIYPTL